MRRAGSLRCLGAFLCGAALLQGAASSAQVQPVAGAGRIVILLGQDLPSYQEASEGIRDVVGGDVAVRSLQADPSAAGRIAATDRPSVVVAVGARAVRALREQKLDARIVFCMILGAEVESLSGPRVTGVALDVLPDRQIEALKEAVPATSKLGVLYDPSRSAALTDRIRAATKRAGVDLVAESVSSPEEVPSAFRRLASRIDALWLIPDATVVSRESFDWIMKETVERRIPTMVFSDSMVRAGGLLALSAEGREVGRQAGELALRVLQGGPLPPVEPARAPRLALSLKVAVALGLSLPQAMIDRAAAVYR